MSAVVLPFLNDVSNYFYPVVNAQQAQPFAAALSGLNIVPVLAPSANGLGGGGNNGIRYAAFAQDPQMLSAVRNADKEEKAEARANQAAIIGAIMTIATAGISAFTLRSYCNDLAELKKAHEFRSTLMTNQDLQPGANPHMDVNRRLELKYVADQVINVLEDKCSKSRNIAILGSAALVSGIAAFIGGMTSLQWLVTASIIGGVAFAAIGVFLTVWYCTADTSLPADLQPKLHDLRQHFESQQRANFASQFQDA